MSDVVIIAYEDRYQAPFKLLNLAWLQQYHLLEDRDLIALDHPRESIIDPGGVIFLAMLGKDVIGSGAVILEHGEYELAKMTVSPSHRGKGISKLLLDKCIDFAKSRGAKRLMLYSNSQLKAALALYRSYGFSDVPLKDSPFVTADVKMELILA